MAHPRNKKIPNITPPGRDTFVTWDSSNPDSIKAAQDAVGRAYDSIEPVVRTNASHFGFHLGMDRANYEVFRPGERIPRERRAILEACVNAYNRVSPIKNIMDMMVDFTTEGIRLVHPNSQVQQFFQNWWKKVKGTDRSQHFANNFYVMGVAIGKRNLAKLSAKVVDDLQRGLATAAADSEVFDIQPTPKPRAPKNVVPWSYDFLNPEVINMYGGELAMFAGKPKYGFDINPKIIAAIKNPRNQDEVDLVNSLPSYIINIVNAGGKRIIIDDERLIIAHYKKNDWQPWAFPMLYSVMDDIILLQKMKLTDLAALDGAISHIRIWKLGSLEHKIMPTEAAFQKLNEVLVHAGNGQSFDLIWGPDLTLDETTSDVYKYLGQEKYIPVLSSLYSGLGIPPTLVGGSGGDKGFTNNAMSLKTLIERLNYGRTALVDFWEAEAATVQQAMQFRFPAQIEFKNAVLTDEASFNSLLVDLLDRDVISVERVREHLGYIPEIEEALVKYEWKARKANKMPSKAGPFHDSDPDYAFKKIFAQLGAVTPSQLGIELEPNQNGEKSVLDVNTKTQRDAIKVKQTTPISSPAEPAVPKKGQQGEGRPKNSKDTTTRKTKRVTPRTNADGGVEDSEFVDLLLWATDAQEQISEIVHPFYLKTCNKKNMRQLTTSQVEDVEHLKFALLCNVEPHEKITTDSIVALLQEPIPAKPEADNFWRVLVATYLEKRQTAPTVDDIRQIQSYVYALYNLGT